MNVCVPMLRYAGVGVCVDALLVVTYSTVEQSGMQNGTV